MDSQKSHFPNFIISQIGRLYKKMLKDCDKIFRELEFPLEMDQIPVFLMLYYTNGASQQEICTSLQRDKASVNRTVNFLTKAGLTKVVPYGDSKRKTSVQLTASGKKLAKQAEVIVDKYGGGLAASLSEEERQQFNVIIQKLMDTVTSI